MNQQTLTRVNIEFDNPLPDNTFCPVNTIHDQSAKIYAAVINHDVSLPDDEDNSAHKEVFSVQNKYRKTPGLKDKARIRPTKDSLALLQEEYALWLW